MPVAGSASPLQGLFNDALRHHRAGRLAEAAELYRQVLAADPRHAHTLQLLGLVAHQSGRHGEAVELIGRAIALKDDEPAFHLNMGLALKSLGRLDDAVASYDRAIALAPDMPEAHNNRAVALRGVGAAGRALAACERALACRPDFAAAESNRGDIFQDLGRLDEAVASYDRALALDPSLLTTHHGRGTALLASGKPAEAIASFDRALALRADYADGHASRADALYHQRRLPEALAGYDRALALRPHLAALHHNRGNVLADLGRPAEALASYDRALALQPNLAETHIARANMLRSQGAYDLAVAGYDRAIALKPDLAPAHYNRGDALARRGDFEEAIASYDRALTIRPEFAEAHLDRGTALKNRGLLDEAIAAYDRAIALGADIALAHAGRAEALHRQGKQEDALAGYERALALDPKFAVAHHGRGSVLADLNRLEEALASYDRTLGLAPEMPDTQNNRANVLHALGRYDEAIAGFDRAIALRPNFTLAHYNRGNAANSQDRFDEAVASYDRVIALEPDHAMAHYHRGNVLSLQGKFGEAVASYDRVIALKPDHAMAHCNRGVVLRNLGLAGAAAESFGRALALEPHSLELASLSKLSLPVIMHSTRDIVDLRTRYRQGIADLMKLDGTLQSNIGGTSHIFYLAYNGLDDRSLLEEVGAFFRAKAPSSLAFEAPHVREWQPPRGERRIRVGFLSEYFREHTIEKLYRGLIRHLDRTRFEVVLIHAPRGKPDSFSEQLDKAADRVVTLPPTLTLQQQAVAEQRLDVLFYPDIGMNKDSYFLAFARLAPVQAVSWGHPNTTGLPSIDYFVSSESAEPVGAERHYTERLVRLGRLPCFYERPELPATLPGRRELGLPEHGTLYGCPQSLFKFHPDFDAILAEIAAGDPEGHIVIMQGVQSTWTDLLRQRWARSHPSLLGRVLVLQHLPQPRFVALLSRLDILLDPIHFGSGNTLYEAMACGTPIVTWPGNFMRGRIVAGAYRQMGVADAPVAARLEDYAPLALALGRDPVRRAALREASRTAADALFDDWQAVRELEAFMTAAVEAAAHDEKLPAGWRPDPDSQASSLDRQRT